MTGMLPAFILVPGGIQVGSYFCSIKSCGEKIGLPACTKPVALSGREALSSVGRGQVMHARGTPGLEKGSSKHRGMKIKQGTSERN